MMATKTKATLLIDFSNSIIVAVSAIMFEAHVCSVLSDELKIQKFSDEFKMNFHYFS